MRLSTVATVLAFLAIPAIASAHGPHLLCRAHSVAEQELTASVRRPS